MRAAIERVNQRHSRRARAWLIATIVLWVFVLVGAVLKLRSLP